MLGCEKVLVENVTVNNRLDVPNCDGIDPDHCRDVEIRNCNLTCGDDAIVIKSTRQAKDFGDCADIRVHDCVIRTQDAGLKIGTETTGDIHDILFERCKIISASRGLCIQLRDEGNIYNVTFRDIQFNSRYHSDPWWGRGEGISFTAIPRSSDTKLGRLHDILVENVSGRAENSVRVCGTTNSRVENVILKNVSVKLDRWTKYRGGVFDNRPTKMLDPVETHDNPGFSIRCADDVTLKNCAINWGRNLPVYFTGALETENVTGLQLTGFKGSAAHPGLNAAIFIH
jgi:Glycosyl hydrolases family 28